uniref:Uncharacterized protein n=1 Tax=Chromera velia CCMP2878 TaxID=1169474 RepID=A0A0G4FFB0_9ALVE|eukprot:Cvel_16691.t1-p1 / transcript=Cvel_16691.t1 / gene=Cvel_16691 / organism=Chromera_velia_CCMP2878 / gene_product=hypothetical protein / transcript_product=hypothetical protein / location=Cvel_scaffold1296:20492-22006(-) / protein_length=432 / sequence_SO=supercontig / SO=protein_coding / is_pseudo=false
MKEAFPFSDSQVPEILLASGLLGLGGFWKVTSLSKEFVGLRDGSIWGVCAGFDTMSEREEIWRFLESCFKWDNVCALQQLFSLKEVSARYPFLLRRLFQLRDRTLSSVPPLSPPQSLKCVEFLSKNCTTPFSPEMPEGCISTLTRESLSVLLKNGAVHPNAWVLVGAEPVSKKRTPVARPLITALIDARKFDCVETLIEAGARSEEEVAQKEQGGGENGDALRFSVLRRIAKASKEAGCLHWTVIVKQCYDPAISSPRCASEKTALHLAVLCGEAETARVILEVQKELRAADQSLPFAAVSRVSDSRCLSVLKVLGKSGVDFARVGLDEDGYSLLSICCRRRLKLCAEFLLQQGAAVGGVPGKGGMCRVPLIESLGCLPLMSICVQWGADPNQWGVWRYKGRAYLCTSLQAAVQLNRKSSRIFGSVVHQLPV